MHPESFGTERIDRADNGLRSFVSTCAISTILALAFQAFAVHLHGGGHWGWLIHAGTNLSFRAVIENDLGDLGSGDPVGHDGQMIFAIARDPFGRQHGPDLILAAPDDPQYRYRRILYPLLAGGGGLLSPEATLWGMILLAAFGFGLTVAACREIADGMNLGLSPVLLAGACPGLLLSFLLLLSDSLAVGLALTGLALAQRRMVGAAVLMFSLAGLSREIMLIFAIAAAFDFWRRDERASAVALAALPVSVLASWSAWVAVAIPKAALQTPSNIDLPGFGLSRALAVAFSHGSSNAPELLQLGIGVAMVLVSLALCWTARRSRLATPLIAWTLMASLVSAWVWQLPNNALRVLSPLWILAALTGTEQLQRWHSRADS